MPRALLIAVLVLLAAAPAATAATARAKLTSCTPALEQEERSATFAGDVRAIPGSARLQVRFVLQARTDEEPEWAAVSAPGFGSWNSSAPGIGRYVYTKTVENLLAPAAYRALVQFRWLSATGRTLLRTHRTSRVCRQPDLRPDLVAEGVARTPDGYEVMLANLGRTDAESFTVAVEVDGALYTLAYVESLGPRQRVTVRGEAPPCRPGTNVVVRVDADGVVDEADEDANALSRACPLPGRE